MQWGSTLKPHNGKKTIGHFSDDVRYSKVTSFVVELTMTKTTVSVKRCEEEPRFFEVWQNGFL